MLCSKAAATPNSWGYPVLQLVLQQVVVLLATRTMMMYRWYWRMYMKYFLVPEVWWGPHREAQRPGQPVHTAHTVSSSVVTTAWLVPNHLLHQAPQVLMPGPCHGLHHHQPQQMLLGKACLLTVADRWKEVHTCSRAPLSLVIVTRGRRRGVLS
jgi:hypothetical protein